MALNLADCVALSAQDRPDKCAIIFGSLRMTYAELAAAVQRVASLLKAKGIGPGDRVAMLLPNTPQFPIVYYGILHVGATAVTLNVMLKKRELLYQLQDSGVCALFVWKDMVQDTAIAVQESPACKLIIEVEAGMSPETPDVGESFMALMMGAEAECDMAQTSPDDTAVILYTSALDGEARGAMLTHFNLFQNSLIVKDHVFHFYADDIFLTALPLFHSFGQTTMMTIPFLAGSTIVMMPRFDGQKVLEAMQEHKVTMASLVPTMFHLMVESKKDHHYDLSNLRAIVSGGQALPLELFEKVQQRFGLTILEGYGLTETSPVVTFNRTVETNKPGSIGTVIWGCHVQIRREDGSCAATGEVGEMVVRGPNVMKGYLNKPEATAKTMAGGWLHTGDLAYQDDDGYIFITGLKKDMIIRAGMNIYPAELEKVILGYPAVAEVAVMGLPDTIRGEEVRAFVVLKEGVDFDEKDLSAYCRENLASYKCPRKIEVVESLPRTNAGKVDKEALRNLALQNA